MLSFFSKSSIDEIKNYLNNKEKVNLHNSLKIKSKDYWEKRYAYGGNSGPGSYNHLAKFKAAIINNFVNNNNISTVIEWGCGDGNQLTLATYKNYIGYDVSQSAINICKKKFYNDSTKAFYHLNNNFINNKTADLSLSLDVIYHLIEDNTFEVYMNNLFKSSNKYIIIYSSNVDKIDTKVFYVRHRKFSNWIDKYMSKNWKLKDYIPNKYPLDLNYKGAKSFSNFYIYEKISKL